MKRIIFNVFSILLVVIANIMLFDSLKHEVGPIFSKENIVLNILMVISWFFIGRMLYMMAKTNKDQQEEFDYFDD